MWSRFLLAHHPCCTSCTTKKKDKIRNNKQRVEGRKDKHGFRTASIFKHPCVCYMLLSRELSENPLQLPKMLTHLVIVFTVRVLVLDFIPPSDCSEPTFKRQLTSPASWARISDSLLRSLTPTHPSVLRPFFPISQVHGGTALCGLLAKIDKGVPLDTLTPVKNTEDEILSLPTHPRTHTETHRHTLYIYTISYIHECSLSCYR